MSCTANPLGNAAAGTLMVDTCWPTTDRPDCQRYQSTCKKPNSTPHARSLLHAQSASPVQGRVSKLRTGSKNQASKQKNGLQGPTLEYADTYKEVQELLF